MTGMMRAAGVIAIAALLFGLTTGRAAAHPADRLIQHLMLRLAPAEATASIAIGGGLLANELVLEDLDTNADGTVDEAEARTWLTGFLADVDVLLDNQSVSIDPATATLTVPNLEDFHLGLAPLIVAFSIPMPMTDVIASHRLVVRNDYMLDRTDYRRDVETASGAAVIDEGWPGHAAKIAFEIDPSRAVVGESDAAEAAAEWDTGGVAGKAKRLLDRPKTPAFLATLIGVFLVMGALHAIQPGHGKTLVAAYLVATGGTARDALTLAGVVTFTHTISVFALGFATLAASQIFLPARVVPALGLVSGLLVVAMGAMMLRGAVRAISRQPSAVSHPHLAARSYHPSPITHHHHHHHHHHEHLSDEEHARLHLEETRAAMADGRDGRPRVSTRSLVALGISGGLAPCPDALAILLLAVGINQLAFGMLAIVAFSLGLAGVLVAFGLAIALAGPVWSRASRLAGERRGGFGRLVAVSPVVSAAFVLLLGLAMLWRAGPGA